jgi:hypothetical protein
VPLRVWIVQSEAPVAEWLARYFTARGDLVVQVSSPGQAMDRLDDIRP